MGFAGVLLIVKPGATGFELAALLPDPRRAWLCAVDGDCARPMGRTETAAAMSFWGNICFLLCAVAPVAGLRLRPVQRGRASVACLPHPGLGDPVRLGPDADGQLAA